jgi:hypothetical protein
MSSVSNALAMGQMQVAIARKQLDSVEQQGQNALALIQAAAPPAAQSAAPANVAAGVGAHLNITA